MSEEQRETLVLPKETPIEQPIQEETKPQEAPTQPANSVYDFSKMSKEEIETEAQKWGAIPKDDWRGDKEKWQDPETFLKNSVNKTPAHLNQIKKQNKVIDTQNKIIKNLKEDLDRRQDDLKPQMKRAFEEGDFDEYNRLQRQEENLKTQKSDLNVQEELPTEQTESEASLEDQNIVRNWIEKNNNYTKDLDFTKKVDNLFFGYQNKFPQASTKQILDAIDMNLKNTTNNNIYNSSPTSNNSTMGKPSKVRGFNQLTSSAQKMCTEAAKFGVSKEDYIKNSDDMCFVWGNK